MSLPDHVALALGHCSVNKYLTFIEADFESTNNCFAVETESELLGLVNFVSDIIVTRIDKEYLVDFIEFVMDGLPSWNLNRFQLFQHLYHEVLVVHVIPGVVSVFNICLNRFLLKLKELPELLNKVLKQKFAVKLLLNISW